MSDMQGESGFLKDAVGPKGLFAVFEDDGETGYLYLYEPNGRGVISHLRIYVRSPEVNVAEKDVSVEWSEGFTKYGVRIWGKFRGIVDVCSSRDVRILLEGKHTLGISDSSWLDGFAHT